MSVSECVCDCVCLCHLCVVNLEFYTSGILYLIFFFLKS